MNINQFSQTLSQHSTYHKKTIADRKRDMDQALREYLQSYIDWMSVQNEHFADTLSPLELSNYFIKKLTHPLWFRLYLKFEPFVAMVYVDTSIRKYMYNTDVLEYTRLCRIRPIDNANYKEVSLKYYSPSITYKQADMIAAKCKQAGVTVYPQEIASMTNRDVDYIMAVLSLAEQSAQKDSKKGGI